MKKILLYCLLLACRAGAQTPGEDELFIHAIAVNIFSSNAAHSNLHYLTKNIGARLSGSPQMYQAEQWGAETLQGAGADTVLLQACMVPHWVRGGKDVAYVVYKTPGGRQHQLNLNVLALGNSQGSGKAGVTAPLLRIRSFDELEAKKNAVKGTIVFYDVPFDDTLVSPFAAYGKNVVYRGTGASRAARYGAVGMLMRSMTNTPGNHPHTGSLRYTDSISRIPAAAIGLEDVEKLRALLDENISLTASLFTYGKMLPDTIAHNVIGQLKGSVHPEQVITIGGHLDSWDVGEGAHDDGAGIVQTIEVLRVLKALHYQPKHTLQFVLFANEENGTRGGRKYAEEAKQRNEQHVFALESDAGGFTPRGFSFDADTTAWKKLQSWQHYFTPYYGDRFVEGEGGADIGYLKTLLHTPQAGLNPDPQRYFSIHHAATDVFENVDIRELKLGAINMAALIYLVDKYGLH